MNSPDNQMSRVCNRVMSAAQSALDTLQYVIEDAEFYAGQHPDREDIKACEDEIKTKCKTAISEVWAIANHWGEHFDSISVGKDADEQGAAEPISSTSEDTD